MTLDDDLMVLSQSGAEGAFAALVRRHRPAVMAVAMRTLRCAERAEDATQDTFVDLYRGLDRYRPMGKFEAYLFTILRNHCRMQLRSGGRARRMEASLAEVEVFEGDRPDRVVMDLERRALVERRLGELSPKVRPVVELRLAGRSYREIAGALGIDVGTVKSRLWRGLRAIRMSTVEAMADESEEPIVTAK
jgi:RNA polymerase sigma-70 factor (ECF subfamily)